MLKEESLLRGQLQWSVVNDPKLGRHVKGKLRWVVLRGGADGALEVFKADPAHDGCNAPVLRLGKLAAVDDVAADGIGAAAQHRFAVTEEDSAGARSTWALRAASAESKATWLQRVRDAVAEAKGEKKPSRPQIKLLLIGDSGVYCPIAAIGAVDPVVSCACSPTNPRHPSIPAFATPLPCSLCRRCGQGLSGSTLC